MKYFQAIRQISEEKAAEEFSRNVGIVKDFLKDYPYGQEDYTEVDEYKRVNKIIGDLQIGTFRNAGNYKKVVKKSVELLDKMAKDFGVPYKAEYNKKWHDAMHALAKISEE